MTDLTPPEWSDPQPTTLVIPAARCYAPLMLATVLGTLRRFQIFSILLLAMVFTAPAFESHACPAPSVEVTVSSDIAASPATADDCAGCPDCGPACAEGCCHAPHSGITADLTGPWSPVAFARPSTWDHVVRAPISRPAGPERPPRS